MTRTGEPERAETARRAEIAAEVGGAISHPLRVCIIRAVQHHGEPLSRVDFVGLYYRDDVAMNLAGYHFRLLHSLGVLDIVRAVPSRGSYQHFYGLALDGDVAPAVLRALDAIDAGNGN